MLIASTELKIQNTTETVSSPSYLDLHHLYVATFQHHLHMEYIYLSWYIILAVYVYLYYTVYKAIQDVIIGLHHNGTIHSPYSTNYIELHHNMQKFPEYNIELFFFKDFIQCIVKYIFTFWYNFTVFNGLNTIISVNFLSFGFNATLYNISIISCRSLVEETGVSGENHGPQS